MTRGDARHHMTAADRELVDQVVELILPHGPQAAVVRRIFDLYTREQMGSEAITGLINDEGHRTKNGVPFSARIVLRILSNPIYVGRVTFQDQEFEGLHERLINEATFAVAARILEERGESQALRRGHPADYLLTGVVRCGLCDRAFIGTSAKGRSKLYHYYTCSTRYRYGTKECGADRLPKDDLEHAVFEQMVDIYRDSGVIADALEHLAASEAEVAADTESRLLALRQEQATVRRSIDHYFAAFEQGSMSPATCQKRIEAIESQLDALIAEEHTLDTQELTSRPPVRRSWLNGPRISTSCNDVDLHSSTKHSSASSSRSCG